MLNETTNGTSADKFPPGEPNTSKLFNCFGSNWIENRPITPDYERVDTARWGSEYSALHGEWAFSICGSAYDQGLSLHPCPINSEDLKGVHPEVVAIPFYESPFLDHERIIKSVPVSEYGVRCQQYLKKEKNRNIVFFVQPSNPSDWVGFVCFHGSVLVGNEKDSGQVRSVSIDCDFVYINPKYRGQHWGPIISAMCGKLISETLLETELIEIDYEDCAIDLLNVSIYGEATSEISNYLIHSLSNGVHFHLTGLECKYHDRVQFNFEETEIEW